MRRWKGHMGGQRYCGNIESREIHDLDHEKPVCQINEIITACHDRPFESLTQAHLEGFDDCLWCIGVLVR